MTLLPARSATNGRTSRTPSSQEESDVPIWAELGNELISGLRAAWIPDLIAAWIYGGHALEPAKLSGDTDIVVVREFQQIPERRILELASRRTATVHIVDIRSLGGHDLVTNGGFYYTGKLLAPRVLLVGERERCDALLREAFHRMQYPWALALVTGPSSMAPTAAQKLARLYMLKLQTNAVYANHFAYWCAHPGFARYWRENTVLMENANEANQDNDALPFHEARAVSPEEWRQLVLEYLSVSWWNANLAVRRADERYVDSYYARHARMRSSLDRYAWTRSVAALQRVIDGTSPSPMFQACERRDNKP